MRRRDRQNEVVVAVIVVSALALAVTFGIVLNLSSRSNNGEQVKTETPSSVLIGNITRQATPGEDEKTPSVPATVAPATLTLESLAADLTAVALSLTPLTGNVIVDSTATAGSTQFATDTATVLPLSTPTAEHLESTVTATTRPLATDTATIADEQALIEASQTATAQPSSTLPAMGTTAVVQETSPTTTAAPRDSATPRPTRTLHPTATATVTVEPSLTSTSTPTPTATRTASPTPTLRPSATATASATRTATATATATASSTRTASPTRTLSPTPAITATFTPFPSPTATPFTASPSPTPCIPNPTWLPYIVQPGDTLFELALQAGLRTDALRQGNCIEGSNIVSGQTILLPPHSPIFQTPTPQVNLPPGCDDPQIRITSPRANATLNTAFVVRGLANGLFFGFYRLSVKPIGGSYVPVFESNQNHLTEGELGTVTIQGIFQPGEHSLQLEVYNRWGNVIGDCEIPLTFR